MKRFALAAIFSAAATAQGGTLQAELHAGCPAVIRLESAVDDAHLANPAGYHPAEPPVERVVERIVVENVGRQAVRNPDVRLNGAPILPVSDPVDALGLAPKSDPMAIFSAWRDRRIHGTTALRVNRDPLEVLRAFGATFCGDDANALGTIMLQRGAEVRFVWVSGHSVAEHRVAGGDWTLIDGDQNLFYPRWDNCTAASGADLVADPLLALRAKVYGRNARWETASAWQNTSRFEFVDLDRPQKILRLKQPPERREWELRPGERIAIQPGVIPEAASAANESLRHDKKLREALCRVEFYSSGRDGRIKLPFPLLSRTAGDPVYEIESIAGVPVVCQAARLQFPLLRSGENKLETREGELRVTFETREILRSSVPTPSVHGEKVFRGAPRFEMDAKGADRVWWQISVDRDFRFVAPNLDRVADFASTIALESPLDETFLSPKREYVFRAKVRRSGVWSDWSEPAIFTVEKPAQPKVEEVRRVDGAAVLVRWKKGAGEMLVFGSDRLDFLPEIFGGIEPTRLENGAVKESRPPHNLLAVLPSNTGEASVPARAAYRLIARESGVLSVPSALVRLPAMRARVLQNRQEKAAGALTGRDVAIEMDVP